MKAFSELIVCYNMLIYFKDMVSSFFLGHHNNVNQHHYACSGHFIWLFFYLRIKMNGRTLYLRAKAPA